MSDQQHIDDFFKKGLEDYAPQPSPDTWQQIADRRKKKRPVIAWWYNWRGGKLLIFFIIVALIAGGGILFSNNKKAGAASASTATSPGSMADIKNTVAERQALPINPSTPNNTDVSLAAAIGTTQDSATAGFTKANLPVTVSSTQKNKNDGKNEPAEATAAIPETISTANKKNIKVKRRLTPGRTLVKASSAEIVSSYSSTDNDSEEDEMNDPTGNEKRPAKMPFNFLLITAASFANNNKGSVLNGINGPDCPGAEKNAAGNKTYWEVYTSIDYSSKKYTDTANSLLEAKRKATTSFYSAYSAGIRFTRVFNNGVSIRAGLNYSQINEKFSFIQSNTVQTTYIIDALTGDTTGSYIVKGTKYKTSFNNYRTLDIPLVFGYEIGNGRLHANFNAGAMINLYSWQKGELLDTAFQPVTITTGKGLPAFQYKTNIGVGFTAAASLYYKLNDRLHLLAEPYFRYNFSPMNREALSLQERFTTMGLRIGVRLDF